MTPYQAWGRLMKTHYGLERALDLGDDIRAGANLADIAASLERSGCPPEEAQTILGAAEYALSGHPGPGPEDTR